MKKVALPLLLALVFGIGLAVAGEKTHEMTAEIVSVDVKAKTITIKGPDGENHTAPVLGKAAESLASLKAGDNVTLTCKDKDTGEHEGVTAIKLAKATAAK